MPTPLTLHTRRRGDGTVLLTATGELDLSNIEAFSKAIAAAVNDQKDEVARLVVDLSTIEYLDSAAINALFEQAQRLRRIIANPVLMPVLTISGLTAVVEVEAAEQN